MYVCLCNGFTERDVHWAVAEGASSPAKVYRALETAPQCGRCKSQIKDMLTEHGANGSAAMHSPAKSRG